MLYDGVVISPLAILDIEETESTDKSGTSLLSRIRRQLIIHAGAF